MENVHALAPGVSAVLVALVLGVIEDADRRPADGKLKAKREANQLGLRSLEEIHGEDDTTIENDPAYEDFWQKTNTLTFK